MKRLIVIDISSFIFRAFYAIRPLSTPEGTPVNAVYGVLNMLLKLLEQYKPSHILVARDTAGKTFRHEIYEGYKANRSAPPDDLIPQFDLVKQLLEKMEMLTVEAGNYEADDIIGSVCVQWEKDFDEILIVSSDKDLMQFINDKVKMLDTMKDKIYDREGVYEKMGVWPEQITDYLSIVGDSSDNIPGLKGIGPKGASKLLAEYGTLENCIANRDKLTGKKVIEAFTERLDDAKISKKLVLIDTNVILPKKADDTTYKFHDGKRLDAFLQGLGFKSVLKRLSDLSHHVSKDETEQNNSNEHTEAISSRPSSLTYNNFSQELDNCLREEKLFGMHFQLNAEGRPLIIALSFKEKDFWIETGDLKGLLENILTIKDATVAVYDAKMLHSFAVAAGVNPKVDIFEIRQAHFLLHPDDSQGFIQIVRRHLGVEVDIEQNVVTSPTDLSKAVYELFKKFYHELKTQDLLSIYDQIDGPLFKILAKMEYLGVKVDASYLKSLEVEFQQELDSVKNEINVLSDTEVNLNSPKQVGHLLFEVLGYPTIKKTKTGYSTDSEVLEELESRALGPVPGLILKHREIDKLLSTYVKTIPEMLDSNGRIHTHYSQSTAATGRLASTNPNLQNIPTRTENGRRIRKAFVAEDGKMFVSADYSQVELRLLAHFSEDPTLLKAFQEGRDIHAQTASEVLGKSLDEVTREDRSMAKAVNFGLMYGQSSFGLASTLKISRNEANLYIIKYFEKFSSIKTYLDQLKEFAEMQGYSKTLHGRKRFLPNIQSTNRNIKAQAERMAINTPIQGTAADIIKLAMINIDQEIREKNLSTKMILQVHDELIFEAPENEVEVIKELIKTQMQNVVSLKVPLTVDLGVGKNWFDLK